MPKLTPEEDAAYALDFNVSRSDLSGPAQLEYDRLLSERAAGLPGQPEPLPPRFPSAPRVRREILEAIASKHEKYARPFDRGRVATFSRIGTDSWAEYGEVVLQMATLDTLISIEEKLSELLQRLEAPSNEAATDTLP